jgi:hypothetical protein
MLWSPKPWCCFAGHRADAGFLQPRWHREGLEVRVENEDRECNVHFAAMLGSQAYFWITQNEICILSGHLDKFQGQQNGPADLSLRQSSSSFGYIEIVTFIHKQYGQMHVGHTFDSCLLSLVRLHICSTRRVIGHGLSCLLDCLQCNYHSHPRVYLAGSDLTRTPCKQQSGSGAASA